MICDQCRCAGQRSRVYPGQMSTTLMASSPYYDEDGNYVHVDPNTTTEHFRCSNGHRFCRTTLNGVATVTDLPPIQKPAAIDFRTLNA